MIKEALQFLINLGIKPDERLVDFVDADGNSRAFAIDNEGNSKEIKPLINRATEPLRLNTLTGLVAYIKANIERQYSQFYLQVFDETTVYLKGVLDGEGDRKSTFAGLTRRR
jgi:hypothetical protein